MYMIACYIVYKEYVNSGYLKSKYDISWKLHIDGVPLSGSSGVSGWPVLLKPNEVLPSKRKMHTILAGLWVGYTKTTIGRNSPTTG